MKIKSNKDLNIWKRSIGVVGDIYKITKISLRKKYMD